MAPTPRRVTRSSRKLAKEATPKSSGKKKTTTRKSTKKKTSPEKRTPGRRVIKKLDLDDADKENSPAKRSTRKRAVTPKGSAKKRAATPKRSTKKKAATPKSSAKKTKTPKSSRKKTATPKSSDKKVRKTRASKATPQNSSKKKTATPKSSGKKTTAAKGSAKKRTSTRKAKQAPVTSPPLSEKVKNLSADSSAEEYEKMFKTNKSDGDDFVLVQGGGPSDPNAQDEAKKSFEANFNDEKTTNESQQSSTDLSVMTGSCIFAYIAAYLLPGKLNGFVSGFATFNADQMATLTATLICGVIFLIGFIFAKSWSKNDAHALNVYRVSHGIATILVASYLFGGPKFEQTICTGALSFGLVELVNGLGLSSLAAMSRVAIEISIASWTLIGGVTPEIKKYNTYVLIIFTAGCVLASTDAVHSHVTIGYYVVVCSALMAWAYTNNQWNKDEKHVDDMLVQPSLTICPALLAIIEIN
mmetsp:Transcript_31449/g.61325  ORF Transcript_31449/g.61325 Transcript_31449/m.61325 type:complete len:471 (-) Transcript_31449:184-1596(-)|eukprot:CAMPEP_0175138566 /NCGR_PEP_ID=MMETSP0087-20121206/10423_1 /TAXON_ID=136419 /ORGANISM="Unknown Unknown, Strain D1" /LENGTH=470 /DNA_ID=CAMNT_0016421489 /DNA_START=99 /DNA_END=1511 /DNA_ORIENTATION=+